MVAEVFITVIQAVVEVEARVDHLVAALVAQDPDLDQVRVLLDPVLIADLEVVLKE